jgi:NAD(P)-dependent dehydrogenase (short-subunit alcohol dehydrogenase family)
LSLISDEHGRIDLEGWMTSSGELDGKVAIVSGAARGQGRAIAQRLAEAGARVVGGDVLVDELLALGDDLGSRGRTGRLDIRDRTSWDELVDVAVSAFGRLDILVNNAGIMHQSPLEQETAEGFEDVWRVNCLGPFLGTQAVLPHLRSAGGGAIVNTLSTAAFTVWTNHAAYSSSKWALRGFTKVAALELAADRIRVNAIAPGPIATPMVLRDDNPRARERLKTPLGRIGEPEDIADAVLFLVSERSSFVTGSELTVDGGQIAGVVLGGSAP